MARFSRAAAACSLLLLFTLQGASACYFARGGGSVNPLSLDGGATSRRALQQARQMANGGHTCSNSNINTPTTPVDAPQGTADAAIRELAWKVMLLGGAGAGRVGGTSKGLLKANCGLANVALANSTEAWNCVDFETLGTWPVNEPIPPELVAAITINQAFSLGTFVRLAFHDCGAARRTGVTTSTNRVRDPKTGQRRTVTTTTHNFEGGCDGSFFYEAQFGLALNGATLTRNAGQNPRDVIMSFPGNGIPAPLTRTGAVRDYPGLGNLGRLPTCTTDPLTGQCAVDPVTGLVEPFILFNPNGDPSLGKAMQRLVEWKADIDALIVADARFATPKAKISLADLAQLSGAAVVTLTGGNSKAEIYDKITMGRRDVTGPTPLTSLLQLPAASDTITQQTCLFRSNGYTTREMVALIAAHTVGHNDVGPMSPRPNNFDNDYLQFVKSAGLVFESTGVPQVSAGFVTTPVVPAPGIEIFLPAFISDLEFYTMAQGVGPIAVGVGGAGVNPLDPPAARSGLPNPLGRRATADTRLPSPTRPIIDGWLAPGGWTTYLSEFAAAYLKMGKMGNTVFTSHGNLVTVAG